jgi:hypothetical protein
LTHQIDCLAHTLAAARSNVRLMLKVNREAGSWQQRCYRIKC